MTDKNTRSRFTVIVEEMFAEEKLELAGSFDNAIDVLTCNRCGCNAFTPSTIGFGVGTNSIVTCRGCPLPNPPSYKLPEGFKLDVSTYRCQTCGKRSDVTSKLSEINLWCCGRPTLHWKQLPGGVAYWGSEVERTVRALPSESFRFGYDVEEPLQVQPTSGTDEVVRRLAEEYRKKLGLQSFRDFAARQRDENMRRGFRERDWDRRTGRTTHGLVVTLAQCQLRSANVLYLKGSTVSQDRGLYVIAVEMIDKLERWNYPKSVMPLPDGKPTRLLQPEPDTVLYVDHLYREETRPR